MPRPLIRTLVLAGLMACAGDTTAPTPRQSPLQLSGTTLAFTGVQNGDSVVESFNVQSAAGQVRWTATSNVPWLTLQPSSGTTPASVAVVLHPATLDPGQHTGIITVNTSDDPNTARTLAVTLTLAPAPVIAVGPTALAFSVSGAVGDTTVAQTLTVSFANGTTTPWTATADVPWLALSPASGVGNGATRVTLDAAGLTGGTYTGTVTITAPGATGSPQRIPVTVVVPPRYSVTVLAQPSELGTVSGAGTYVAGQTATVTAIPLPGGSFLNWMEGPTILSTNAVYSFLVNGNHALIANFQSTAPTTVQITAGANPTAGGTITGAGPVTTGATVTLTATAATGYAFVSWTEGTALLSTNPVYTFTATGPRTLVANFTTSQSSVTITATANPAAGGTVAGGGLVNTGSSVTLTATPATGYTFTTWTESGTVVSTSAAYTFSATASRTLVANFTAVAATVTIAASAAPPEGGTVTGAGPVQSGATVTLTATPNAGFQFTKWTENGTAVSTTATYSFTASANRTLVANFLPSVLTVTTASNPPNGGTTSGGGQYAPNTSVIVKAVPAPGFRFTFWYENGKPIGGTPDFQVVPTTSDRHLVAYFINETFGIRSSTRLSPLDSLTVTSTVESRYQVVSATLMAGGRTVPMKFVGPSGAWVGTISTAGMPRALDTAIVTATDATGNTTSEAVEFLHDVPPSIVIVAPDSFVVARPTLALNASCVDDDPAGCRSFTLSVGDPAEGQVLTSGTSRLPSSVSLAAFDGTRVTLTFTATDSRNQVTTVTRAVYVESSKSLDSLGSVPGLALDYRGGRAVYTVGFDRTSPVVVRDLASGSEQRVNMPASSVLSAFVTPLGAIVAPSSSSSRPLYELRNGVTTSTSQPLSDGPYVEGSYAIFTLGSPTTTYSLNRRDLVSGTDVTVAPVPASIFFNSVTAAGDVAYGTTGTTGNIYLYHASGVTTQMTNSAGTARDVSPATDGNIVVFTRTPPCCASNLSSIVLSDGTTETILRASSTSGVNPGSDYQVRNGWVAFTNDASGVVQVWLRSPTGTLRQLSLFAQRSSIRALGADGTVVFENNGRLYAATATGSVHDVGGSQGTVIWRDGAFYDLLGRVVFALRP